MTIAFASGVVWWRSRRQIVEPKGQQRVCSVAGCCCDSPAVHRGTGHLRRYGVQVDNASIGELAARYVTPFYLDMMRVDAAQPRPALLADIAATGADAPASDVVRLLRLA